MQAGILGNNETLRRLWGGLLLEIVVQLNSDRGPEREEQLKKLLRDEMMPVPASAGSEGIKIVKTVVVMIGGRTTDQIVADARKCSYVNPSIKQTNIPSGHGRRRPVVLEFFEFDHDPATEEVRARCEEPGYGYPTYEDGLRFQEDHPDDQQERSHIFVPENLYCDAGGYLLALYLHPHAGVRGLDLVYCDFDHRWYWNYLFARRKYLL